MRFILLLGLFSTLACSGCGETTESKPKREKPPLFPKLQVKWLESYDQAVAESKKTGKPIFAFFTGSDWCRYCSLLDYQVLSSPEFSKWSKEHVTLLKLDFPQDQTLWKPELKKQNNALMTRYRVTGFPTILFLTSDGEPILRTGYEPGTADQWIAAVEAKLEEIKNGKGSADGNAASVSTGVSDAQTEVSATEAAKTIEK